MISYCKSLKLQHGKGWLIISKQTELKKITWDTQITGVDVMLMMIDVRQGSIERANKIMWVTSLERSICKSMNLAIMRPTSLFTMQLRESAIMKISQLILNIREVSRGPNSLMLWVQLSGMQATLTMGQDLITT